LILHLSLHCCLDSQQIKQVMLDKSGVHAGIESGRSAAMPDFAP